jgi:hypothetical protein
MVLVVVLVLTALGIVGSARGQKDADKNRHDFAKAALERIAKSDKATAEHKATLNKLFEDWKAKKDATSWKALHTQIAKIAAQAEIKTNVTIKAVDGAGKEVAGLRVRYRFPAGDDNAPTAGTTPDKETWTIGNYNIWVENNDGPVSPTDAEIHILGPNAEVNLLVKG